MGQPTIIHDFNKQLQFSEAASDEPFWDAIYRKAFPGLVNHMLCSGDVRSQRLGIDRSILLSSGKTLYIDEKKRREDWPDILLEYISVDTTGAPGWIEKELQIDYLAYAFMQSKRVYLYDWLMLRRAWLHYRDDWKREHKVISAQNNGYKTLSLAVPIAVVNSAVSAARIIQL